MKDGGINLTPIFINKIVNMESESCVGLTIMLLLVLGIVFVLILDEFKMK